MIQYGISFHGNHAVIKIIVGISQDCASKMSRLFSDLIVSPSIETSKGTEMYKIEGCIRASEYPRFKAEYKKAIVKRKIETLTKEHDALIGDLNDAICRFIPDDDLPF